MRSHRRSRPSRPQLSERPRSRPLLQQLQQQQQQRQWQVRCPLRRRSGKLQLQQLRLQLRLQWHILRRCVRAQSSAHRDFRSQRHLLQLPRVTAMARQCPGVRCPTVHGPRSPAHMVRISLMRYSALHSSQRLSLSFGFKKPCLCVEENLSVMRVRSCSILPAISSSPSGSSTFAITISNLICILNNHHCPNQSQHSYT